jgi:hypothetical protein
MKARWLNDFAAPNSVALISSKDIAASPPDKPRPDGGCNRDEDVAHILPR